MDADVLDLVLDLLSFTLFPSILISIRSTEYSVHSKDLASTSPSHFEALRYNNRNNGALFSYPT